MLPKANKVYPWHSQVFCYLDLGPLLSVALAAATTVPSWMVRPNNSSRQDGHMKWDNYLPHGVFCSLWVLWLHFLPQLDSSKVSRWIEKSFHVFPNTSYRGITAILRTSRLWVYIIAEDRFLREIGETLSLLRTHYTLRLRRKIASQWSKDEGLHGGHLAFY